MTATVTKSKTVIERTYKAGVEELWALWTTKEGFESWWGPIGCRVEVHNMEARQGGAFFYDMITDGPEQVAEMKRLGFALRHETRGKFGEYKKHVRLVLNHVIDFLPGIKPYESTIEVDFYPKGDFTRMVVTLHAMHDDVFTGMATEGFTSQLSKLDDRYHWKG